MCWDVLVSRAVRSAIGEGRWCRSPTVSWWTGERPARLEVRFFAIAVAIAAVLLFEFLFEDPGVDLVADLGHQWQVIPTEARGILPLVAILVEPADRHVVERAGVGLVLPDRGADAAQPNLVNRTVLGFLGPRLRCSCHALRLLQRTEK